MAEAIIRYLGAKQKKVKKKKKCKLKKSAYLTGRKVSERSGSLGKAKSRNDSLGVQKRLYQSFGPL